MTPHRWYCADCSPVPGPCDDCSDRYWEAFDRERARDASPWRRLARQDVSV